MIDTQYFFITGPPRSGTTWLSNLLTDHDTVCYHELAREKGTAEATVSHLKAQQRAFVGDCGPLVMNYAVHLAEAFPNAQWVRLYEGEVSEVPGVLSVPLKRQFEEPVAKAIWNRCCPGLPWDADRFHILSQMRVTTLEEKAFGMMNPNIKRIAALQHERPRTELEVQYYALLKEMCGVNTDAFEWLQQWSDVLLTWDHIVDGDPINVTQADDMFQDILLKWPYNNFWRVNGPLLVPTISNGVAAWHYSNEKKDNHHAYRVYTDTALAIAYILGGRKLRDKWSTRLKELVDKIRIEDDTRDGELESHSGGR